MCATIFFRLSFVLCSVRAFVGFSCSCCCWLPLARASSSNEYIMCVRRACALNTNKTHNWNQFPSGQKVPPCVLHTTIYNVQYTLCVLKHLNINRFSVCVRGANESCNFLNGNGALRVSRRNTHCTSFHSPTPHVTNIASRPPLRTQLALFARHVCVRGHSLPLILCRSQICCARPSRQTLSNH